MGDLDLYDEADGATANKDVVNLIVGGIHYSLEYVELGRFPDSYFTHLMKDEWNRNKSASVVLDRDGEVFRCIYNYIYFGSLGSTRFESIRSLIHVRKEADFYNLPGLISICDKKLLEKFKAVCQKDNTLTRSMGAYHCMQSSEDRNHLVNLLQVLRPRTVSVGTQSHVFAAVQVPSYCGIPQGGPYLSCFEVTSHFRGTRLQGLLSPLAAKFDRWPLYNIVNTGTVYVGTPRVFEFRLGGSCAGRTYVSITNSVGMIVYIYPSTFTGGAVHCTAYSTTYTISKPGECMAIQAGCTYTVDAVTSGSLLVVEIDVFKGAAPVTPTTASSTAAARPNVKWGASAGSSAQTSPSSPTLTTRTNTSTNTSTSTSTTSTSHVVPVTPSGASTTTAITKYTASSSTFATSRETLSIRALASSIDRELQQHNGIVICLSRYYNVTHSTTTDTLFTTDFDLLCENDASLYDILDTCYEISLVTVYVGYTGFTTSTPTTVSNSTSSTSNSNSISFESCVLDEAPWNDDKIRVIVPYYGFGETFQFQHHHSNKSMYGTILTGIYVRK